MTNNMATGARRPDVEHVLGEGTDHRFEQRELRAVAPTITFSRPASASVGVRASGASTKLHALGLAQRAQTVGRLGLGGRGVDDHQTLRRAGQQASARSPRPRPAATR